KLATKVEKVILWICLVLFVIYIALAYSRTVIVANIGLCFVISIYTVLQLKKKKALSAMGMFWRVAVRFGILTVGLLAAYFLINCICLGLGYIVEPNRLSSELIRPGMMAWDETLGVADARIVIWSDYLHALLDRPLFGFSADGSFAYVCEHNPLSFVATIGFFHHHNTYVQALCQVGIVGFVLIYSNVFIPLIKFIRRVITGQDENCPAHVKLCFLWCVVALSAGFFYSIGFTQIRIEGCILWLALGGISAFVSSEQIRSK
ncbi:MAG: O-antigen ligase family protein, partial [Eubacterium sp.]|nr:O-antigen ligase family protein [Eubacterium sp.]